MRNFRLTLIVLAGIIMLLQFFVIDYSHLGSRPNIGSYMGLATMGLLIMLVLSHRREIKQHQNKSK